MARKLFVAVIVVAVIVLTTINVPKASAQDRQYYEILMPVIERSDAPKIDGTLEPTGEWSTGSENTLEHEGKKIVIRTMHDREFIYVLIQFTRETEFRGLEEEAEVCFDTRFDGSKNVDDNYCVIMDFFGDKAIRQGDEGFNYESLPDGFEIDRVLLDADSPYFGDQPRLTYEVKVPIDYLGRESQYGFRVDLSARLKHLSWPGYGYYDEVMGFNGWGILTSPDATTPEFPLHVLGIFAAVTGSLIIAGRSRLFPRL